MDRLVPEFPRLQKLPPYIFSVVNAYKEQVRARGADILDLGMGNPDQPPFAHITEALVDALQQEDAHRYATPHGIAELRTAMAKWYQQRYQIELDVEQEVVVTIGSKEGLGHLAMALVENGDTVVVPDPAYPIHTHGFAVAGARIASVPLKLEEDFLTTLTNTLHTMHPKPRVLMLNFPSNPTTYTVERAFFEAIVDIAAHYGIWVVHDLAYADIVFDGYRAPSILEIPKAKTLAIETFSLSKSYNMPGWRVGFACGNRHLVAALRKMKAYFDYGLFKPIQCAAMAALHTPYTQLHEIASMYQTRRNALCMALQQAGWEVVVPKATMFVWAKLPQSWQKQGSLAFVKQMVEDAHVALSPGSGFGTGGEGYVRFSLIESPERLQEAVSRLQRAL